MALAVRRVEDVALAESRAVDKDKDEDVVKIGSDVPESPLYPSQTVIPQLLRNSNLRVPGPHLPPNMSHESTKWTYSIFLWMMKCLSIYSKLPTSMLRTSNSS